MTLEATTYSASRGYSWSSVPAIVSVQELDRFYRFISAARGDFPDPLSVDAGLVSDGKSAAVFTLQNVERWDSENRASNYAAFGLFPVDQTAEVDFIALLNNDFFWTPSRTPPRSLVYAGGPSEPASPRELLEVLTTSRCLLRNPRAVGDLIARLGARSPHWVCLMQAENVLKVECSGLTQPH